MSNLNNKALNPSLVSQIVVTNASTDGIVQIGTYDLSGSSYTDGSYTLVSGDLDKEGVKYEIQIKDDGTVTYIGYREFYHCTSLTSVIIPNSVTSIGYGAFYNCTSLTSITIPNSVTSIGYGAFYNCTSLTSITIDSNVLSSYSMIYNSFLFSSSTNLTSVTIGNNVTSIANDVFKDNSTLQTVTIGNNVTSIGERAFYGCTGLTSIIIPDSVDRIWTDAFALCDELSSVTLGNGVTRIDYGAFGRCIKLTSITIPDSVTYLGGAFARSGLTSLVIPDSVTEIGFNLCYACTDLTSVIIGKNVTIIGNDSFNGCTSLTSITFNFIDTGTENHTTINRVSNLLNTITYGTNVFLNVPPQEAKYANPNNDKVLNPSLVSQIVVTSPSTDNTVQIGTYDLSGSSYTNGLRTLAQGDLDKEGVKYEITIPDSVTSIGNSVFSGCTSLTEVTIPNSVTSIGVIAFYGCTSLTSVTIPNSVTSIASSAFYNCTSLTSVTIDSNVLSNYYMINNSFLFKSPINLTSVTIGNSVTSIGEFAFKDCTSLTEVIIPNSVTSIGNEAFKYCTSLTSVTIPDSVTIIGEGAFSGTSLTSVTIPDSVTSIRDRTFYNCTSLKSVTIPDSVTSIGYQAFSGTSLTSVTIPNSVTSIGNYAFSFCYSLRYGNNVGEITEEIYNLNTVAWSNCFIVQNVYGNLDLFQNVYYPKNIKIYNADTNVELSANDILPDNFNIELDSGIITLNASAFAYCDGLKSVNLNENLEIITNHAFYKCTNLTSVTIGNSVTSIGNGAFNGCTSLTSVTIGNSVTSIGNDAFNGCTSLTEVTIDSNVISNYSMIYNSFLFRSSTNLLSVIIGNSVTSIANDMFKNITTLQTVTIGNSVTSIGTDAFRNCTNLSTVMLGNGLTRLDYGAFASCTSLTSITIPDSVTYIGGAFARSGLTSLVIPDSVTEIGFNLCYACIDLTSVTIGRNVTFIGNDSFNGCTALTSITFNFIKPVITTTLSSIELIPLLNDNGSEITYGNTVFNSVPEQSVIYNSGTNTVNVIDINNANINTYFKSFGVDANENINFRLTENVTLNSNVYMRLNKGCVFDGQGHTINMNGISFNGLFKAYGGISLNDGEWSEVNNLGVINGSVKASQGSIIQTNQKYFKLNSCYSTCNMGENGGGLVGSNCGSCLVKNCFSTCEIKNYGGGIIGNQAGKYDNCIIENCYSTGNITGVEAGGVAGKNCGYYNTCTISNCYSTGNINSNSSGGITGNNSKPTIVNCYSNRKGSNSQGYNVTNGLSGVAIDGNYDISLLQKGGLDASLNTLDGYINDNVFPQLYPLLTSFLDVNNFTTSPYETTQNYNLKSYTVSELKQAGFTAAELKQVEFTLEELIQGGFTVEELLEAGFKFKFTLIDVTGIPEEQIFSGTNYDDASLNQYIPLTLNMNDSWGDGWQGAEISFDFIKIGNSEDYDDDGSANPTFKLPETSGNANKSGSKKILILKGVYKISVSDDKYSNEVSWNIKFGDTELLSGGANQMKKLVLVDLKQAEFTAEELKQAEFTAEELKQAEFTAEELKQAEFTAEELKQGGFTAAELKQAEFTLEELKQGGFTAAELKQAEFTLEELNQAGFTAAELKQAGFTLEELNQAEFTLEELKQGGFTAAELKQAEFTLEELKQGGFTAAELKQAGFTLEELNQAEFTLEELKQGGFTAAELKQAEFTLEELNQAGFTAAELKQAGFTLEELKQAGFKITVIDVTGIDDASLSSVTGIPEEQIFSGTNYDDASLNQYIPLTLNMNDGWGDGWQGAEISFDFIKIGNSEDYDDDGSANPTFKLPETSGNANKSGSKKILILKGVYKISVSDDKYSNEVSWNIKFGGTVLLSGGANQTKYLELGVAGCTNSSAANYNAVAVEDDGSCTFDVTLPQPEITENTTESERNKIKRDRKEAIEAKISTGQTETEKDTLIDELVTNNSVEAMLAAIPEVETIINSNTEESEITKKNKVNEILKVKQRINDAVNKISAYFTQKKAVKESTNLNSETLKDATIKELKSVIPVEQQNVKLEVDEQTKNELLNSYNIPESKIIGKALKTQIVTDATQEIEILENEVLAIEVLADVEVSVKFGGYVLNLKTTLSSLEQKVVVYNDIEYVVGDIINMPIGQNLLIEGIGSMVLTPIEISGCMDPLAANYNALATKDDESCFVLGYYSETGTLKIEYRRK